MLEVWMIGIQKSLVSMKGSGIIKVSALGNRYKLHLSLFPGACCLIEKMGFSFPGLDKRKKNTKDEKRGEAHRGK